MYRTDVNQGTPSLSPWLSHVLDSSTYTHEFSEIIRLIDIECRFPWGRADYVREINRPPPYGSHDTEPSI